VPQAPFWPHRVAATAPVRLLLHTREAPGAPGLHRYEYVFPDRHIEVYDIDHGHRLVAAWSIPEAHGYRGVAVSPATAMLYLSVGGNGGSSGNGSLIAFSLLRNRILWERAFPTGTDSPAITPDGRRLFLPTGERTMDDVWYVVDARTGEVTREIHAGPGPHNTIVAPDGRRVYLGPRNSRFLYVASAASGRIVRRVGPLLPGVRPFTIDVARRLAYTTATGFLGFQVSSLATGRVLATVPVAGFRATRSLGTPSHGISLSPDGRELYVIDVPNSAVHVFDVSSTPPRRPRQVANVRLEHAMTGLERPCGGDCGRAGWLQHSLDGRYVYVGDCGDVIDTRSRRVVAFLPALRSSRYLFELDWRGGRPFRTSTRSGIARS
jgi:DNA-binding beta-propeller fold protein YncE